MFVARTCLEGLQMAGNGLGDFQTTRNGLGGLHRPETLKWPETVCEACARPGKH